MNILLTGIDGYLGWPTALALSKRFPQYTIWGVDNFGRRNWVNECGSVSATPLADMNTRVKTAKSSGFKNIRFIEGDLVDREFVCETLKTVRPDIIIHVAAQPSAPYSHINGEKANFTQHNNNQSTRNLLWAVKENSMTDIHFIETTTTGIYGAPNIPIPEGFLKINMDGKEDSIPYPGMATSWYHMSKANDINSLYLANRMWKLSITDLRTAIIYGIDTDETRLDPRLCTRFDFDFYFGVVIHRFCAMVICGYPLLIYGRGEQEKPFISLRDAVDSLVKAVDIKPDGRLRVFNQFTEIKSILSIARHITNAARNMGISAEIRHIPNPRVEREIHRMEMENSRFMRLLGDIAQNMEQGVKEILSRIVDFNDVIEMYKDRFLPEELRSYS